MIMTTKISLVAREATRGPPEHDIIVTKMFTKIPVCAVVVKREKNRLLSKGHKEEDLNSLEDKVSEETSSIISSSRSSLFPDPSTVLENLYS